LSALSPHRFARSQLVSQSVGGIASLATVGSAFSGETAMLFAEMLTR
jgi:hypothetical protein